MVAIAHPAPLSLRPIRLPAATYRRRRLAALGALVVAVTLAFALATAVLAPSAPTPHRVADVTYVVQPGDTLWSIADNLAPGSDLRPVVDALEAANGGSNLVPGQRIVVDLP